MSIFRRGESAPEHRPYITVTDAGDDGSQSRVTDHETGRSIVVENQADTVAQAIKELGK